MVSAISICLLVVGLSIASSQLISGDGEYPEAPVSERRTFKHGKPVKFLPLAKKHKKFGGFAPHVFGKGGSYVEIPVVHEVSRPIYKIHRHPGIELKPGSDVLYSTPEPYIETHSIEPPSDFEPNFNSDHSFPPHSNVIVYPVHEKPVLPSVFSFPSPAPFYAPLPPAPPKPIFSFVSAPQPFFTSIPIPSIPSSPAFTTLPLARPVQNPVQSFPASVPATFPINSPPLPPQPVFSVIPIKIQTPILPPFPVQPSPSPVTVVKIPSPVLPSLPAPSPAPALPSVTAISPTPEPAFSSFPTALPPAQFSIPTPSPSLPPFPVFSSVSAAPEPEFPYPPSGTPIPSYIKDISLSEIDLKGTAQPTTEPLKYEEVTPTIPENVKNLDHVLGGIKNDNGFFQKFKGWKAEKANAALSHFAHFKPKPVVQSPISIPHQPNKVEIPTPQAPAFPTLQFPPPVHSLPLGPAPIFFPPSQFLPPVKYENFPPNNIESPPLLNSYGVPIPHDSYSHASHERLSSAASEEEPAVVSAPSDKKEQNLELQPSQIRQGFNPQNFQPQTIPHPIYVPEDNKTIKDVSKTPEDGHPETEGGEPTNEPTSEDVASNAHNYPNHKE